MSLSFKLFCLFSLSMSFNLPCHSPLHAPLCQTRVAALKSSLPCRSIGTVFGMAGLATLAASSFIEPLGIVAVLACVQRHLRSFHDFSAISNAQTQLAE